MIQAYLWWSLITAGIIFVVVIVPLVLMLVCGAIWDTTAELWGNIKEYWNEF